MSIFLRASERYAKGLATVDPLDGDLLMHLVDPIDKGNIAPISGHRIFALFLIMFGPIVACCLSHNKYLSGQFYGPGGMLIDYGLYGMMAFVGAGFPLIAMNRRLLGVLVNELSVNDISKSIQIPFDPAEWRKGWWLYVEDLITLRRARWAQFRNDLLHLNALRWTKGLLCLAELLTSKVARWIWAIGLVLGNGLVFCRGDLVDNVATWTTIATEHVVHGQVILSEHFNLAGLWLFWVTSPIAGYLVVLMARIVVSFGGICSALAVDEDLRIFPPHPDGNGGLQAVGQVALVLSLFTFMVGIALALFTANILIRSGSAGTPGYTMHVLVGLWIPYLFVGTLLFFLPLLPLNARMAHDKREYLSSISRLRIPVEVEHLREIKGAELHPAHLERLAEFDNLTERASKMIVWPFDRRTFIRYTGLLLTPLASVVLGHLPDVIAWATAYFRVH